MILVIDNYDSFTWNLVHYVEELGAETQVHRNDALSVEAALATGPRAIILSPGPCTPNEAGICLDLIRAARNALPILGVCLGHQAIVAAFGGEIGQARALLHGKASPVAHDGKGVFAGLPETIEAGRYHSLAALTVPDDLEVTARTPDGEVMGVRHRSLPIEGVQFHPESVLTPLGPTLGRNFLERR